MPTLAKLSRAADPWSTSLAVFYDQETQPYVWGLVDQTVHFSRMLVREAHGGYSPPGMFQIVAQGPADLTIYREYSFVARIAQDTIIRKQLDVFKEGPVCTFLEQGMKPFLAEVNRRAARRGSKNTFLLEDVTDLWKSTLCRLLIGIQAYRHGGALLLTRRRANLHAKYVISYARLSHSLARLTVMRDLSDRIFQFIEEKYLDTEKEAIPVLPVLDYLVAEDDTDDLENEVTGCVRFVSALSSVDGLILMRPDLIVKGFGVEIQSTADVTDLYVAFSPMATPGHLRRVDPNHFGTRHRSMMRYCLSNADSLGFVISQDGDLRAIKRIGTKLVMWENLKVLDYWDALSVKEKITDLKASTSKKQASLPREAD